MPRLALTGTRIRDRRLELGLKQAHLARDVGISPAYLNLIEHNKRRIGGKLVLDLARILKVDPAALSEGAQATLITALLEAARAENAGEVARAEEFAGRFPGWAAVLAAQHARIDGLHHRMAALTDRLSYDQQLSDSLHEVLSTVTSIRSTASILAGPDEVEAEWKARFQRNILEDAKRLAKGAGALATYLDGAKDAAPAPSSPQEELEAWLAARAYHLEEVEQGRELVDDTAGELLTTYVQRYARDARALPLAEFATAYGADSDPVRLAERFDVDIATVLRRIAVLPPDLAPAPVGLVVCDGSGTLTFRKPVDGFALPRFGAACPLWPLYQALLRPQIPIRTVVQQAGRDAPRFLIYAIAQLRQPIGFDGVPIVEATMLIVPDSRADEVGLPIGSSCRICPQTGCAARREASILAKAP